MTERVAAETAVAIALRLHDEALAANRVHGYQIFDVSAMPSAFIGALEAQDPPFTIRAAAQADTAPGGGLREAATAYMAHVQTLACDHSGAMAGTHSSCPEALTLAAALAEPGRDAGLRDALWTETPRETAARERRDGGDDE